MILNHIHLTACDLNAAVIWFETAMQLHPGFRNEKMVTFSFNSMTLIFDAANDNASATVGFQSDDCDRDSRAAIERGAIALEPSANKGWGVRAAYFKGPGELKFEIEGPITNR